MKSIAMRCTQEQFEKIKDKIPHIGITDFNENPYLINYFHGKVINFKNPNPYFEIHEQWNEELFLKSYTS